MERKNAFKQKMEAKVGLAQADLEMFKARGAVLSGHDHIRHNEHVVQLDLRFDEAKTRMRELDEAEDDVWEDFRDSAENTWGALQSALQDAIENFDAEHTH